MQEDIGAKRRQFLFLNYLGDWKKLYESIILCQHSRMSLENIIFSILALLFVLLRKIH